jgi:hypothetical protein
MNLSDSEPLTNTSLIASLDGTLTLNTLPELAKLTATFSSEVNEIIER